MNIPRKRVPSGVSVTEDPPPESIPFTSIRQGHAEKPFNSGPPPQQSVQGRHKTASNNALRLWKWQLLVWLLATSIIATILVLFAVYQNRPLSDFKSRVQLATIVAIASVGAQSALLFPISSCLSQLKWLRLRTTRPLLDLQRFDDASRGPWGSLLMLCRGRSGYLKHSTLCMRHMLTFTPVFSLTLLL